MTDARLPAARRPGSAGRCFIGFFGITRGLGHTLASIERNVYAPVERAGFELVRAAHFNLPRVLDAPRSGEVNVAFQLGDVSALRLDRYVVEPQSEGRLIDQMRLIRSIPLNGEADADGSVRNNSLHQLHSLRRLGELFEGFEPSSFRLVLLLRPDLRYLDAFPIRQLLAQLGAVSAPTGPLNRGLQAMQRRFKPAADIVLPAWHQWGGLNDRFAAATPAAAQVYLNRLDVLGDFCAEAKAYQSEHLLAYALARGGVRTAKTWVRAERVRTDATVAHRDAFRRRDRLRWFLKA